MIKSLQNQAKTFLYIAITLFVVEKTSFSKKAQPYVKNIKKELIQLLS